MFQSLWEFMSSLVGRIEDFPSLKGYVVTWGFFVWMILEIMIWMISDVVYMVHFLVWYVIYMCISFGGNETKCWTFNQHPS